MAIQIVCPQCQAAYTIPDEQSGKRVKCKKCETVFSAVAPKVEPDLPTAKEVAPPQTKPVETPAEEAVTRRKTSPSRDAGSSRRKRGRYDDDDDDDDYDRPRSRKVAKAGISVLGLFLIIGGVLGSLFVIVLCIVLVAWVWTANPSKSTQSLAINQNPVLPQPPFFPGDNQNEEDQGNDPAHKDAEVKHVDPPPRPPKELVFISPTSKEAGTAPRAPANIELAPEVVDKVKKSTVYLRVTMPDGNIAQGSGFFGVEPNVILTNAHVIGMLQPENPQPKKIEVVQNSGARDERKYPAEILGVDRQVDLAVLHVKAQDLPPPLEVESAENLRQTQRVWVVGYPLGDRLGKEVTVSDGTVSSIRRDDNGVLSKVQVKGDMQPGNSGGPVIDALGNVVGVSVSILRGTQINFAVPGDWVQALVNGRITRLTLGQPYVKDGNLKLPVTMNMIDPLKHIRQPLIEVWTGKASPGSRKASGTQPASEAGDSPHQKQPLEYKDQVAKGDIALPPLALGVCYWIQPSWADGQGKSQWATAQACSLPPPVEQKPILLALKHRAGSQHVVLNKWLTLKISDPTSGEFTLHGDEECLLTETIQSVDAQEQANLSLHYRNYNSDHRIENQSRPRDARTQKMLEEVKNLECFVTVDKQGNPTSRECLVNKVSPPYKNELSVLHRGVEQMLEGLMVPFPNKFVSPGEPWQAERSFPLCREGQFDLPDASLLFTYTYLGTRKRNGHDEAVVGFNGQVPGGRAQDAKSGARGEGTAVIDLTSGQISEADAYVIFDSELSNPFAQFGRAYAVKANGSVRVRMRRTPTVSTTGK